MMTSQSTARLQPLPPGTTLARGRYTIESVIGQGGFGYVYLAHDQGGQTLAVKQCTDLSSEGLMQFGHEVAIQKIVNNATFVCVYAQFVEKVAPSLGAGSPSPASANQLAAVESLFTVMEYVPGASLEKLLETRLQQNQGPFAERDAIGWTTQILTALQHAHAVGVIHRDIKPGNILLLPDGTTVKVIDFGIAKIGGSGAQTLRGARGVSPGYSPPEQYAQTGQTDTYSDVYAVGATLYHLLTGQSPVDAPVRQSGHELIPPRRHNPALSARIEAIILQAMQLNVADRYQDAEEMLAALQGKRPAAPTRRHADPRPLVTLPPSSFANRAELLNWCDHHWQEAIQMLRSGDLELATQYLAGATHGGIADKVRRASTLPHDDVALETALRALGAKPPRYAHNWHAVERRLGMGWLPDPRWLWPGWAGPARLTFVIMNRGRGYLHGRLDPAVGWLDITRPEFGCRAGQKQAIPIWLHQPRRLAGLAPEILVLQVF
jgi:serine/threonine protein kinase